MSRRLLLPLVPLLLVVAVSACGGGPDVTADDPGAEGIRLVQLGMPWPLDRDEVRGLLRDSAAVLVVEDKLPFLEGLLRDALYRTADAPPVLGKEDEAGRPLLPSRSALEADDDLASLMDEL